MDEMKIESALFTNIISKFITATLRKKIGYDVSIQLNKINVSVADKKIHIRLDSDAELSTEDFMKLMKKCGY